MALLHSHIDGLLQGRRNSSANALELSLSCANPSMCYTTESCHRNIDFVNPGTSKAGHTSDACDDKVGIMKLSIVSICANSLFHQFLILPFWYIFDIYFVIFSPNF